MVSVTTVMDIHRESIRAFPRKLYTKHEKLGEVLRQVPGVVVHPILIASEATRHVLDGVRNQLMPDARKEELAKYCDDTYLN